MIHPCLTIAYNSTDHNNPDMFGTPKQYYRLHIRICKVEFLNFSAVSLGKQNTRIWYQMGK